MASLAVGLFVSASACAAFDVFEPAGPADLVISYAGPAELQVGQRAAITVSVLLAGVPLSSPRLRIAIDNPSVIELLSAGDSIVGLKPGTTDLVIRLEHSIFGGAPPDTSVQIRVKQSGGPNL